MGSWNIGVLLSNAWHRMLGRKIQAVDFSLQMPDNARMSALDGDIFRYETVSPYVAMAHSAGAAAVIGGIATANPFLAFTDLGINAVTGLVRTAQKKGVEKQIMRCNTGIRQFVDNGVRISSFESISGGNLRVYVAAPRGVKWSEILPTRHPRQWAKI